MVRDKIISLASHASEFLHNRSTTKPKPFLIRFLRDRDFVNRGDLLSRIDERCSQPAGRAALVGLGGMGKSQLAIEYVYRIRDQSPDTLVFWIHGSNAARFEEGYREIADIIELAGREDPKANIFKLVHDWLRGCKEKWLMVLDNVDEADFLVDAQESVQNHPDGFVRSVLRPLGEYLPQSQNGSILMTTRSQESALKFLEPSGLIPVGHMDQSDAVELIRKKLESTGPSDDSDSMELAATLDFMPLAIVQAAAYIFHGGSRCSIRQYLMKFKQNDRERMSLLENNGLGRHRRDREAKNSIIITWHISFDHIYQTRPSAANLLSLMSFFDRQSIPESLLRDRAENETENRRSDHKQGNSDKDDRSSVSKSESDEDKEFEKDLQILRDYSFIYFEPNQTFKMHALVQLAMRRWLEANGQLEAWKQRYIKNLSAKFPTGEYENWSHCRALFPHAKSAIVQRPKGKESLKVWSSLLLNIATYVFFKGDLIQATNLHETAMEVTKEIFGQEHKETLYSMDLMGLVYRIGARWEQAEELQVQVIEIKNRVLGRKHPSTLMSVGNLASTFSAQKRWKEAEELYMRIIEIQKRVLGQEHLDTLNNIANLASIFEEQERWKEAEELFSQVIEIQKRLLGQDHPDTLYTISKLASIFESQKRSREAEELQMQLIEIRKRAQGDENIDTSAAMDHLALMFVAQERWEEAEELQVRILETRTRLLGQEHPFTLAAMASLAITYRNAACWMEALELEKQVLETRKRMLGEEHPDTKDSLKSLALTVFKIQAAIADADDSDS